MSEKPKLSMYWAAACGGCEISLTNLQEKILDVDSYFDFLFCPCLLDTKKADIEALADQSLDITMFNGAIRTAENEEMAVLLRKKSKILISYGSCSYEGCIPGLSNLFTAKEHFETIYLNSPSVDNPDKIVPQLETEVPEGILKLPEFYDTVKTLEQVVEVDYKIPGCPPESHQLWNVIELVIKGGPLPSKGSIIGAGQSSVCNECDRIRKEKKIKRLYRNYEIIPDQELCLLEQGLVCMGIATRDGCGALCPKVNMPCTGCYGAPEGVLDQGAKMAAALGSIIDVSDLIGVSKDDVNQKIDCIIGAIPDYAGMFYKYSLANSILKRSLRRD